MPLFSKPTIVPDVQEIQKAHDILCAVILGEVEIGLTPEQHQQIQANCEALCWILGHEHNPIFGDNLINIQKAAHDRGYRLYDSGGLQIR